MRRSGPALIFGPKLGIFGAKFGTFKYKIIIECIDMREWTRDRAIWVIKIYPYRNIWRDKSKFWEPNLAFSNMILKHVGVIMPASVGHSQIRPIYYSNSQTCMMCMTWCMTCMTWLVLYKSKHGHFWPKYYVNKKNKLMHTII